MTQSWSLFKVEKHCMEPAVFDFNEWFERERQNAQFIKEYRH